MRKLESTLNRRPIFLKHTAVRSWISLVYSLMCWVAPPPEKIVRKCHLRMLHNVSHCGRNLPGRVH